MLLLSKKPSDFKEACLERSDDAEAYVMVATVAQLESRLAEGVDHLVVLDFDTVAVENRTLKRIGRQYPTAAFLCVTGKQFNPAQKELIRDVCYACLVKPVDPDEFRYWLRSIRRDLADRVQTATAPPSRTPPEGETHVGGGDE